MIAAILETVMTAAIVLSVLAVMFKPRPDAEFREIWKYLKGGKK